MVIEQGVLPNARLSDDFRICKVSIVYKVLYFMLEAETIFNFMVGLLVEVAIFIEVPSGRYVIRHRCAI